MSRSHLSLGKEVIIEFRYSDPLVQNPRSPQSLCLTWRTLQTALIHQRCIGVLTTHMKKSMDTAARIFMENGMHGAKLLVELFAFIRKRSNSSSVIPQLSQLASSVVMFRTPISISQSGTRWCARQGVNKVNRPCGVYPRRRACLVVCSCSVLRLV